MFDALSVEIACGWEEVRERNDLSSHISHPTGMQIKTFEKNGEEQGSKSSFSLLSEPISPSSLLFISSSRSIQFNSPYSQLFFFSLLPTFFGPFLPPPSFELATYQFTVMKNPPSFVQESGFLFSVATVKLLTNEQTKQARVVFS